MKIFYLISLFCLSMFITFPGTVFGSGDIKPALGNTISEEEISPDNNLLLPQEQGSDLSVIFQSFNVSCTSLGSASVNVLSSCSGTPTIRWNGGTHTGNNITNLIAGSYSVTVSDVLPCHDTVINFTITEDYDIDLSILSNGLLCTGPVTLSAFVDNVNPSGISYVWNTTPPQYTQSISVNAEGTYRVTATYGICTESAEITVSYGDFFDIVYDPYICQGSNSSAIVNHLGGSLPQYHTYKWDPGQQISQGIDITTPGTYTVTVTNIQTGCSASKSVDVFAAPPITLTIDSEDISCFNMRDGSATALPAGGVGDFTYQWSIPENTQTIENLVAGNYAVTVTDEIGCTESSIVYINEPELFEYTITPNTGICLGQQTTINTTVSGGTQPYSYAWAGGSGNYGNVPSITVSPQVSTTYSVTVVDNNGCTATPRTSRVTVSQPISIDVRTRDVSCYGFCDGRANLDITGGIAPLQYSWASNTDYMENICAGNYNVTVTDLYNCTGSASFSINQPDSLVIVVTSGDVSCFGYTDGFVQVETYGGVKFPDNDYRYSWSFNSTVDSTAVHAGFHSVTVTDANGCYQVGSAVVTQPEGIVATNPVGGTICIGEPFSTSVSASGGTSPYDFVWRGSDSSTWYGPLLNISPRVTTSYTLSLTDSHGCVGPERTVTVTVNPQLNISNITSDRYEICLGDIVTVDMDISGGNGGPYDIIYQNGQVVNTPYSFYPNVTGYYKFTADDDCATPNVSDSVYIVVHPLPEVGFESDIVSSCPPGIFNFSEITTDNGQTYLWNFGDGGTSTLKNPQHRYRDPGYYTVSVTATSAKGCKYTHTVENMIRIYENPVAEFIPDPDFVSVLNAHITFYNHTVNGGDYYWDYGDGTNSLWSDEERQIHSYKEVGDYMVMLVARNEHQCVDTIHKRVRVHDAFTFYAPTAFTPNGDGLNDFFYVFGHGIVKDQFNLTVHDRFGNVVFETNYFDEENPYNMSWDGTNRGNFSKGDTPMPNGVYIWRCKFMDLTGKTHQESGTVNLIR